MGLTRVMLFNYWLTYSVLKAKRPKFQPMLAPTAGGSPATVEVKEELEEDKQEMPASCSGNGNGAH